MEKWLKIALSFGLTGWLGALSSEASPVHAEFKFQETLAFDQAKGDSEGAESRNFQFTQSSLRLKIEHNRGAWSWDGHLLLGANYSQRWQWISSATPTYPAKDLFDLDTEVSSGEEGDFALYIDRAAINYTADKYTLKFGRQALTWGNGKFFNPMDRFAPFSPHAQDTSYKRGADMLYIQRLFDSGSDLQVIYLPRRNLNENSLDHALSSFAAKYLFGKGRWQFEALVAEDWDDEITGGSAVGSLGSALWSTDVIYTRLVEGGDSLALTTNLQHAWTWSSKPIMGFVEYAHNGLGVRDLAKQELIPSALFTRIARGQYFNTGRDYLGIGFSAQWNPLLNVTPSAIFNLHDNSGIVLITAQWNASNRDNIILGLQSPFGPLESEYGSSNRQTQFYLRWERYF